MIFELLWLTLPFFETVSAQNCSQVLAPLNLSWDFPDRAAHGIHSLTLNDIRMYFDPNAKADNGIPTVNVDRSTPNLLNENPVLLDQPTTFSFPPLHILDVILSNMDDTEYGIKNSNIIDKIAHDLHMSEIWTSAAKYVKELYEEPLGNETCSCLISSHEPYMLRRLEFLAVEIRNPEAVYNFDDDKEDESEEGSDKDIDEEDEDESEEGYDEEYDEEEDEDESEEGSDKDDDGEEESSEEEENLNERRKRSPATQTLSGGFWPGKYAERRQRRSPAKAWPGKYAQRRQRRSPATQTLSGGFWPGKYAERRQKRSPAKTLAGGFWPGKYAQRTKREVEDNSSVANDDDDDDFPLDPTTDSIVDAKTWKAWKDLMVWPYPGFLEDLSKDMAIYVFCKLQN